MASKASYTYLTNEEWDERIDALDAIAQACALCPRKCGVNRHKGEKGFCDAPGEMLISSIFAHHGEEPPISGTGGSGTIFFSCCTLRCAFCQNFQISQDHEGRLRTVEELAEKMCALQESGCHNVNLVTPSHFLPWILRALRIAANKGLEIPIVYNCGGYELVSVLRLLRGIVDIYLPDMKYGSEGPAKKYSCAGDYPEINRAAIREMFHQVGPLRTNDNDIAVRGLCIRHLVLPDGHAGTLDILKFLKSTFDPADIFISLMAQYRPLHKAHALPEINKTIDPNYYESLKKEFVSAGFGGYYQEIERIDDSFVIDFKKRKSERLK